MIEFLIAIPAAAIIIWSVWVGTNAYARNNVERRKDITQPPEFAPTRVYPGSLSKRALLKYLRKFLKDFSHEYHLSIEHGLAYEPICHLCQNKRRWYNPVLNRIEDSPTFLPLGVFHPTLTCTTKKVTPLGDEVSYSLNDLLDRPTTIASTTVKHNLIIKKRHEYRLQKAYEKDAL